MELDRCRFTYPPKQAPVDGGSRTVTYEIAPDEENEPRMRIAWGGVIGDYDDREKLVAMHVLHSVIAHNNHSPLVKCILDRGLAEDVIVSVMDSVRQPYARIEVRNYAPENTDLIRTLIHDELNRLVKRRIRPGGAGFRPGQYGIHHAGTGFRILPIGLNLQF